MSSTIIHSNYVGKKLNPKRNFHLKTNDIFNLSTIPLIDINAIKTGKKRLLDKSGSNFDGASLRLKDNITTTNFPINQKLNFNNRITTEKSNMLNRGDSHNNSSTIPGSDLEINIKNYSIKSDNKTSNFCLSKVESIYLTGKSITSKSSKKCKSLDFINFVDDQVNNNENDYNNKLDEDKATIYEKNVFNNNLLSTKEDDRFRYPNINAVNKHNDKIRFPVFSTKSTTTNKINDNLLSNKSVSNITPKFKVNKIPILNNSILKSRKENGLNLYNNLSKDYNLLEKTFRINDNLSLDKQYNNNKQENCESSVQISKEVASNYTPSKIRKINLNHNYASNNRSNTIELRRNEPSVC